MFASILSKIRYGVIRFHQPRAFWLITFVGSLMSLSGLFHYFGGKSDRVIFTLGLTFFALLKTEILTAVYIFVRRWGVLRVLFYLFWAIFIFLSIVNFFSLELYGFGISIRLMNVMVQTNPREISGFMPGMLHNLAVFFLSPRFWISAGAGALLAYGVYKCRDSWFNVLTLAGAVLGCAYVSFYVSRFSYNRMAHFIVPTTMSAYKMLVESEREFNRQLSEIKSLPYEESVGRGEVPCNVLLIIGESASRDHHGVYGYVLQTTPNLTAMSDSVCFYQAAIGSSASTGDCVPKILTFESDEPHDDMWSSYPSVFQLFNAAGYKTYWFSNQDRSGNKKGTYSIIASQAGETRYVGIDNVNDHLNAKYDEELLPEMRRAVADTARSKLIAVHLFGSHTRYADRYPPERSRFTADDVMAFNHKKWVNKRAAATIAEYDNSILYTDSILGETIRLIGASPDPYVMIYVSDHGENVYDDRNFIGRDEKFVDVPMLIYMNRAYMALNPEMKERVIRSLERKISSSMIIHALMTLTGVSYVMYDPAEDFLSDTFRERLRYSDGEPYFAD